MAEYEMALVDRQIIARDTMAFWLDTMGADYEFRPGQHADFSFLRPSPEQNGDNSRTFSFANCPQDKSRLTIAMRMRRTGFKDALKAVGIGARFKVGRPRGSFTLHKDNKRPAVFLAGGIGITPVRSIVHWTIREGLLHKLYLFYSNREPGDAAFLEELEGLAKNNPSFTFIPTMTRFEKKARSYESGPIDRELLAHYLGNLNGPVYYVAGPSGMVATMTSLLHCSHISEDDIKTEEFGDYKQYSSSGS